MAAPGSHRLAASVIAVAVGAALVAACTREGVGTEPGSTARPSPAVTSAQGQPPAVSASPAPGSDGAPRLRIDDNGAVVTLPPGGTAVVLLPTVGWTWSDPDVDGASVSVSEDVSDAPTTSRSWTITARGPGTATVGLTGMPTCAAATPPCAAPDLRWAVTVTVQPG